MMAKVRTSAGFALATSPLAELRSPSPLLLLGLFCPSSTGVVPFGCKRLSVSEVFALVDDRKNAIYGQVHIFI